MVTPNEFSRIGKFFVDRDGMDHDHTYEIRSRKKIALCCGHEVAESKTWQATLLTAANIANRCFPGSVVCEASDYVLDSPLLFPFGGAKTISDALRRFSVKSESLCDGSSRLVFGGRPDIRSGLQITFDGWIASVEPIDRNSRLLEREYNVLAGITAGAMAVSEVFLDFAKICPQATRRRVGISLWRPDLPWAEPEAVGVPMEFLPTEFWVLGLGHVGQATLWAIAFLPFSDSHDVNILLNDFDKINRANWDTGLLTGTQDIGILKTRVCERWLDEFGFSPRLVERPFQPGIRITDGDPRMALCAFDSNGPRNCLENVGFELVVEAGLGGRHDNFDAISFHSFPNDQLSASELWKESNNQEIESEEAILKNPFYQRVAKANGCGHMELFGKAVAVPFVGTFAAALLLAEPLRLLNDGTQFGAMEIRLDDPTKIQALENRSTTQVSLSHQPILLSDAASRTVANKMDREIDDKCRLHLD